MGSNSSLGSTILSGSGLVLSNYTNVNTLGPLAQKAVLGLTALSGIPQTTQLASSIIDNNSANFGGTISTYTTNPFINLNKLPWTAMQDFRSRNGFGTGADAINRRLDGTAAITRKSKKSISYLAASITPGGAYTAFNLNGVGKTGYGWGDHGNTYALRNDFTVQSNVATKWSPTILNPKATAISETLGTWKPKVGLSTITPFRGDRVTVIDYKRTGNLFNIYKWKPTFIEGGVLGAINDTINSTQDFIKFYFTGPKLYNGNKSEEDAVMVFRATISSLEESFQGNWTPIQMVGRADSNYHYSSYSRDLSLSFVVAATDRDEMKPIWRKLNALAGYTAPIYDKDTIALKGPWMRMTIGDLLVQQPVILETLSYTLHDTDTTWEINIEDDPEMMQTPHRVSVSMQLKVITDYLPENGGQFYTLAKDNDKWGSKPGTNNWLSDSTSVYKSDKSRSSMVDASSFNTATQLLKSIPK